MYGQDWNTIVIKGKSSVSQINAKKTQPHYEKTKEQKLIEDDENISHKTVSASLGKTIQQARIAKGYKTQKELAQVLNVPPNIINQYESGKAIPDNNLMQKLRRVLQVKL